VARQGKIRLRRTFGKIIYYDWNDIPCMRLKNDHCNQTTKTKACAKIFGIGSKVGNKIINEFKAVIPALMTNHSRNDFVTHLNAWLYTDPLNSTAVLDDVPFITGSMNKQV
jgi:hypothetical protein